MKHEQENLSKEEVSIGKISSQNRRKQWDWVLSVGLESVSEVFRNAGEEDPGPSEGKSWISSNCIVPKTFNQIHTHKLTHSSSL